MDTMRKDRFNIEMEDIDTFSLERSKDCQEWEDVSKEDINEVLDNVSEEKAKTFLGVIRNGSMCQLNGFFYRIIPD